MIIVILFEATRPKMKTKTTQFQTMFCLKIHQMQSGKPTVSCIIRPKITLLWHFRKKLKPQIQLVGCRIGQKRGTGFWIWRPWYSYPVGQFFVYHALPRRPKRPDVDAFHEAASPWLTGSAASPGLIFRSEIFSVKWNETKNQAIKLYEREI